MHILIAEDDFLSRKLLQTNLEQMGHEVTVAQDGAEAWQIFDDMPTRCVVSDWLMPGMDGLELCEKIRARDNTDYTYFVLLTANVSDEENYFYAMDRGVDDFLSKPLDRRELAIRLRVAQRILKDTSRIQSLENIVTICAYTKKVHVDDHWETIEQFVEKHLGIKMTHGIAPDYYEQVILPQLREMKASNAAKDAEEEEQAAR